MILSIDVELLEETEVALKILRGQGIVCQ